MKEIILLLASLPGMTELPVAAEQNSQYLIPGVNIQNLELNRNGKYLTLEMAVDLKALKVNSNNAVLLTPRLVNGTDSIELPSIGVYGRQRYYYYMRNGASTLSGDSEISFRESKKPDIVDYDTNVPYADWMNGAELKIYRSDWGCCHKKLAEYEAALDSYREAFFPELVFVRPEPELTKSRSLSGSAYIDFPVSRTMIDPTYRGNAIELGKIQASIDSVRGDNDVTITSVWLKGFASPEGTYKSNTELAVGRTAALKKFIGDLYNFDEGIIITEYDPEDWNGFRNYMEQSDLKHREEILSLIDSDMDPDMKELKIKRSFPEEYRFLLQNCYPALRHTDYRIDYNIRQFNDIGEIERVLNSQPQKLNLNELYLVAGQHEPGTDEFTDIFETAVRLFPNDETANLNSANAAIRRDDFQNARRYLEKAGDSAEAIYARGALSVRMGDLETGRRYLEQAKELGLAQADKTLDELDKRNR